MDNRTIADEFFRGSFTTGLFAFGNINEQWRYQAMLGNNLSQLGVDAGQLDDTLDTFSGALVWTPLGPFNNGFGDYEQSPQPGLRLGARTTRTVLKTGRVSRGWMIRRTPRSACRTVP